jgi:hypothetical protein
MSTILRNAIASNNTDTRLRSELITGHSATADTETETAEFKQAQDAVDERMQASAQLVLRLRVENRQASGRSQATLSDVKATIAWLVGLDSQSKYVEDIKRHNDEAKEMRDEWNLDNATAIVTENALSEIQALIESGVDATFAARCRAAMQAAGPFAVTHILSSLNRGTEAAADRSVRGYRDDAAAAYNSTYLAAIEELLIVTETSGHADSQLVAKFALLARSMQDLVNISDNQFEDKIGAIYDKSNVPIADSDGTRILFPRHYYGALVGAIMHMHDGATAPDWAELARGAIGRVDSASPHGASQQMHQWFGEAWFLDLGNNATSRANLVIDSWPTYAAYEAVLVPEALALLDADVKTRLLEALAADKTITREQRDRLMVVSASGAGFGSRRRARYAMSPSTAV